MLSGIEFARELTVAADYVTAAVNDKPAIVGVVANRTDNQSRAAVAVAAAFARFSAVMRGAWGKGVVTLHGMPAVLWPEGVVTGATNAKTEVLTRAALPLARTVCLTVAMGAAARSPSGHDFRRIGQAWCRHQYYEREGRQSQHKTPGGAPPAWWRLWAEL